LFSYNAAIAGLHSEPIFPQLCEHTTLKQSTRQLSY